MAYLRSLVEAAAHGDLRKVREWHVHNQLKEEPIHVDHIVDFFGNNILYRSIVHLPVVMFLVKHCGADVRRVCFGQTYLHRATSSGALDTAEFLIRECGVDPNVLNHKGQTAWVHCIRQSGNDGAAMQMIRRFVCDCGMDINFQDNAGHTLLHHAVTVNSLNWVKFLVTECGASCEMGCSRWSFSPVFHACLRGQIAILDLFLDCDPNLLKQRTKTGCSLLIVAASVEHLSVLKYLIEQKHMDVTVKDDQGCTALMMACHSGFYDGVLYLLRKSTNAQLCERTLSGMTAMYLACSSGSLRTVNLLLKYGAPTNHMIEPLLSNGRTPAHIACRRGHLKITKFLAEHARVDFMCKDPKGRTPLHYASKAGHADIVRYLVEDLHIAHSSQSTVTPLMMSCIGGHLKVAKYFISLDPLSIHATDEYGRTVLHFACKHGHLNLVKTLVEDCGCDVTTPDSAGLTPWHHACTKTGSLDVVRYLHQERGVDTFVRTRNGATCLFYGVANLTVTKYLVNACGQDADATNKDGFTPLFLAVTDRENMATVKYLVEECKVNVERASSLDGMTPLFGAIAHGNLAAVKYLVGDCQVMKNKPRPSTHRERLLHFVFETTDQLDIVKYLMQEFNDPVESQKSEGYRDANTLPINAIGRVGRSAMHVACENKAHEMDWIEYLVEHCGADLTTKDQYGCTPFYHACSEGSVELVNFLIRRDPGAFLSIVS